MYKQLGAARPAPLDVTPYVVRTYVNLRYFKKKPPPPLDRAGGFERVLGGEC